MPTIKGDPVAKANIKNIAIPLGGFKTIVIDPPWPYGKWGKASIAPKGSHYAPNDSIIPYETMTLEEIKEMPVFSLSAINCDLYLWTTQKYLPFSFELLKHWKFKYCQILTWCKTPMGTGQGGLYCPTTEFLILARRGKMPSNKKRMDTTWWNFKRQGKHSKKPEEFQDIIDTQSDSPKVELFARRERSGWSTWGNELT